MESGRTLSPQKKLRECTSKSVTFYGTSSFVSIKNSREEGGERSNNTREGLTQIIKTSPFLFHFTIEKRKRFSSRPLIEQIETTALFLPFLTVKKKNNQFYFQGKFGLFLNNTRQKKQKKTFFYFEIEVFYKARKNAVKPICIRGYQK